MLKYPLGLAGESSPRYWHKAFVQNWKLDFGTGQEKSKAHLNLLLRNMCGTEHMEWMEYEREGNRQELQSGSYFNLPTKENH